ncbi:MAG: Septum formation initiator [Acidobacteriaceae bacterium]|nr:Septum formation initiator [Acidobacteriaceae bacterium]
MVGIRALYSVQLEPVWGTRVPERDRSERFSGTNLVPEQHVVVFHLTVMHEVVVLEQMAPPATTRNNSKATAAVRLWLERGGLSWRKVATVAAGLLAFGLGFHVMFGQNGLTAYEQKRQETKSLERQLQSLKHENELLKGHVDRLQTDPNAIEHQAREELHYTRAGEVIYTLPDAPARSK